MVTSPEIAFTGDTMSDFIIDPNNSDVLRAKVLVVESTFVDNAMTVENARDYGHTHLSEIEIEAAVSALPPSLAGRVFALTEGF